MNKLLRWSSIRIRSLSQFYTHTHTAYIYTHLKFILIISLWGRYNYSLLTDDDCKWGSVIQSVLEGQNPNSNPGVLLLLKCTQSSTLLSSLEVPEALQRSMIGLVDRFRNAIDRIKIL